MTNIRRTQQEKAIADDLVIDHEDDSSNDIQRFKEESYFRNSRVFASFPWPLTISTPPSSITLVNLSSFQ
jgi:hypothetical protein